MGAYDPRRRMLKAKRRRHDREIFANYGACGDSDSLTPNVASTVPLAPQTTAITAGAAEGTLTETVQWRICRAVHQECAARFGWHTWRYFRCVARGGCAYREAPTGQGRSTRLPPTVERTIKAGDTSGRHGNGARAVTDLVMRPGLLARVNQAVLHLAVRALRLLRAGRCFRRHSQPAKFLGTASS